MNQTSNISSKRSDIFCARGVLAKMLEKVIFLSAPKPTISRKGLCKVITLAGNGEILYAQISFRCIFRKHIS